MFTLSAVYYDKLYAYKDYQKEARYLADVIHTHQRSAGQRLLDLACGSGAHLVHLGETFDAQEQLDILSAAGFEAEHDPQGPSGRGLFIARKPL